MYSLQVIDHFEHPRNSGLLPDATVSAQVENPVCGDVLELSLRLESGLISAAGFRTRGCVASVACGSKLTEAVIRKSPAEARELTAQILMDSLGGLPEGSSHAAHLAMDALNSALSKV